MRQPSPGGSAGGSITPYTNGLQVPFQSGHTPRQQVCAPAGARMGGNRPMFLFHIDVSLSLSLPPPLPLSKINRHILR